MIAELKLKNGRNRCVVTTEAQLARSSLCGSSVRIDFR
jgi:hypothetical protein